MTGLELTAKIYAGEIKNGTKIKAIKENGDTVNLRFESDMLKWETGVFHTGFLFDKNIKFEIVEEQKGWFKPEMDELYWAVASFGEVNLHRWENDKGDNYRYNNHNCFRSQEEAQEYLEYKKALREAQKPFKVGQLNYGMFYDFRCKEIKPFWNGDCVRQGTTYLGVDEAVVQAFIDKWHDQILKYEFNIWED